MGWDHGWTDLGQIWKKGQQAYISCDLYDKKEAAVQRLQEGHVRQREQSMQRPQDIVASCSQKAWTRKGGEGAGGGQSLQPW